MKIKLELNAKCRNCKYWEFETEDGMDFLEDNETYCKLDKSLKSEIAECGLIDIDFKELKDNLKSAGYYKVKFI